MDLAEVASMSIKNPNDASVNSNSVNPHIFKVVSLTEVLDAIEKKILIEDVDISEKIKDPLFRFITLDNKELSYRFSSIISISIKREREIDFEIREMGNQKKIENANDFAKSMYDIVETLKTEERKYSFREIARILNTKQIPTRKDKKWDAKTVSNLNKRWIDLGFNT